VSLVWGGIGAMVRYVGRVMWFAIKDGALIWERGKKVGDMSVVWVDGADVWGSAKISNAGVWEVREVKAKLHVALGPDDRQMVFVCDRQRVHYNEYDHDLHSTKRQDHAFLNPTICQRLFGTPSFTPPVDIHEC
jgi:hypothetical protein